jgi:Fur family peroxide stress response transcriptional regulator
MAVLQALNEQDTHLSAEEIHERILPDYPMIGLSTVYKAIALFLDMGVISELNISNQNARYEILDDPPHPHFICTRCGDIIDLDDRILEDIPEQIAGITGHQIIKTRLDFYGICRRCQYG